MLSRRNTTFCCAMLVALCSVAIAAVIVGGGKSLDGEQANFQSDKIITGAPTGTQSDNTYQFQFSAAFKVCDLTVRMEDEKGNEITANATNGMTQISVQQQQADGTLGAAQTKTLAAPASAGQMDLPNQVPPSTNFVVNVDAKSTASALKFSFSFSKKKEAQAGFTHIATYHAGSQDVAARPLLEGDRGFLLPVRNDGTEPLAFGRFETVGDVPAISSVAVPGTTFTADVAAGGRVFTLTGGALNPGQTMEVYVEFSGPLAARGAFLVTMTRS